MAGQKRRVCTCTACLAKKPYGVSLTVDEYNLHQAQAAARSRASRQQNEASPSLRKETQEACQCTECLEVDPGGVYRSPAAHKAHQILITRGRNYDPDDNLAAPDIDEGTSSQAAEESGSDIDDIDELSSSFVLATLADEDAVANPSLPPKDKLLTSLTEQLVQLTLGPADTMEGQLPSTMPLPSGSMPEPDAQDAVIALDGRRITSVNTLIDNINLLNSNQSAIPYHLLSREEQHVQMIRALNQLGAITSTIKQCLEKLKAGSVSGDLLGEMQIMLASLRRSLDGISRSTKRIDEKKAKVIQQVKSFGLTTG
ncbi:hypothetical protein OE88DRAFT_1740296 [Heliocybe sulcata]|uniref:Uncharacterized protein n=1 Tax=Heliocybe sulcata TaxID=5364 RepID=A0A5C3MM86_9AGAM|nr:hypothetical protein OE88DRAFT_1740296 [Heliocybe sulcata]